MKLLVILALVAFATAFDFPEEWDAWRKVCLNFCMMSGEPARTCTYVRILNICATDPQLQLLIPLLHGTILGVV